MTANSDFITVTITVTDVNEAPVVVTGDAAVSFIEETAAIVGTQLGGRHLHGGRPGD